MPKTRFQVLASLCSLSRRPALGVARHLAIAVLAVAGVSVSASSARAASSTTCTGSSAVSYSPGLTNTPQTITYSVTDTYSSCTSTDTSLTAGGFSLPNLMLSGASCSGAGVFPPASYTISWNNSQSSTMTLTATDVIIGGTEQVTEFDSQSTCERFRTALRVIV